MFTNLKRVFILTGLLLVMGDAFAKPNVKVVYPGWFKSSFYDLQADLQEAKDSGKNGIMLFFSMKTCSYCNAIIETTFEQADIVKKLRANYDVIGLEVFSDTEVVDMDGKTYWSKDFAVKEKAKFTPTMIFYDAKGARQLRMVGYQSPKKFRAALDYLEGKHYTKMKLGEFLHQHKSKPQKAGQQTAKLNLHYRNLSKSPLLTVVETTNCAKCKQLRTMLKAPVMKPYTQRLTIKYINRDDVATSLTTPGGKQQSVKAWVDELGLIHAPAMVFFNEQGKEILRVDTDILIDEHGKDVDINHERVLDNIRARLQFVLDKGYVTLPQFQRWRAQQHKKVTQ